MKDSRDGHKENEEDEEREEEINDEGTHVESEYLQRRNDKEEEVQEMKINNDVSELPVVEVVERFKKREKNTNEGNNAKVREIVSEQKSAPVEEFIQHQISNNSVLYICQQKQT